MCQTVHSVLRIQQGIWLLVSTEAYNLLEKRITKRMSTTKKKNRFPFICSRMCDVCKCFLSTSRDIIRGVNKKIYVRMLIKLKFQMEPAPQNSIIMRSLFCSIAWNSTNRNIQVIKIFSLLLSSASNYW